MMMNRHKKGMECQLVACMALIIAVTFWVFDHLGPVLAVESRGIDARIVAYYQTGGRNAMALFVALRFFRSVYPDAPLYMHYDMYKMLGDNSTSRMARDFNAALVTYNSLVLGGSVNKHGMYYATVQAAEDYIRRLQVAAGLEPEGWVLLMEDDVWLWAPVKQDELWYDISGTCWGTYRRGCHEAIVADSAGPVFRNGTCYGGYGGHYVNSSRLLGLVDWPAMRGLIRDMLLAENGNLASDMILSALVLQNGGTIGEYPGYYEWEGRSTAGGENTKTWHRMKWLY